MHAPFLLMTSNFDWPSTHFIFFIYFLCNWLSPDLHCRWHCIICRLACHSTFTQERKYHQISLEWIVCQTRKILWIWSILFVL